MPSVNPEITRGLLCQVNKQRLKDAMDSSFSSMARSSQTLASEISTTQQQEVDCIYIISHCLDVHELYADLCPLRCGQNQSL